MLVPGQLAENERGKTTTSFDAAKPSNFGNQSCYGCSKFFDYETMYRCRSCNGQETSATDKLSEETVFCKMCIVGSHLRQDHEIIDYKGYRPAECETHMNLCHYYCEICAVVFCFDCIDDHMSHRFQPITLKATELRKEVFQYLTQNELLAKPIKHKGVVARNCFETKTALLESLSENEINGTLKKVVEEVLCCYSPRWANLFQQSEDEEADSSANVSAIETVIDEAETCHISLRELLQVSDGVFIRNFSEARNKFKVSVQNQQKMLNGHFFMEWTEDLKHHLEMALTQALKLAKIPKLLTFELEQKAFIAVQVNRYAYDLKTFEWRYANITSFERSLDETPFWPCTREVIEFNTKTYPFCSILAADRAVLSVINVYFKEHSLKHVSVLGDYLAIYSGDSLVTIFSLKENIIVNQISLKANCDPLDIIPWQNGSFSCLLWNRVTSEIQFSDESSELFSLLVKEKPSLVEEFVDFCCFAFTDSSVGVWDTVKDRYLEISKLQHGLSAVDKLKFVDEGNLCLFDYKLQLMVEISFVFPEESLSNKCSVQRVIKISPFPVNSIKQMTVMDGRIIAYADGNLYAAKLNE